MALTHLLQPTPAPQRPSGVTCEAYVRGKGKHCLHYRHGGGCTLPDVGGTCTEWLKVNRQARSHRDVAAPPAPVPPAKSVPAAVDLFGHPLTEAGSKKLVPAPASKPAPPAPSPDVKELDAAHAESPLSALRGLTDEDIASFKALGAEVCFASETYGEVWLVPAYTGQARKELTPEHAATLVRVLSAFPGSRVLSFTKQPASAEASP
ncbi:hypothetical protein ACN6A1_27625 [Myxococcus virescens]|uniref:hypothetical protein n=1 Tax=Myxococcus virescens TaxID=83456 RepID=UPI003DA5AA3E